MEFVQVDVQGTVEAEGRGDGRDDLGDEAVEVGVAWLSDTKTLFADIEDGFVINLDYKPMILLFCKPISRLGKRTMNEQSECSSVV